MTKLFRITRLRYGREAHNYGGGSFCVGKVYPEELIEQYGCWIDTKEYVGDLPDSEPPRTLAGVRSYCQCWIDWVLTERALVDDLADPAAVFRPVLRGLRDAVTAMPEAPALLDERPVRYTRPTAVIEALKRWRDWAPRDDMVKAAKPSTGAKEKRPGRPRKTEPDNDTKLKAALALHHQYEPGGSIGIWEPATGRALARLAGVTGMAVTRFMQKHFKDHRQYQQVCQRRKINEYLLRWQDDLPEWHAELRADE